MNVGIIDADLLSRKKHRFPNLVSMKLSSYHKNNGDCVQLLTNWNVENYDQVYISKVFTDTIVPDDVLCRPNVQYGGTGFFFDKAVDLSYEIEHCMPDYHLYDGWINTEVAKASGIAEKSDEEFNKKKFMVQFKEYTDYSIGFITRGCFRKCPFCVNQKYDHVFFHSNLSEFYDDSRKKICLLDDNIFGYSHWRDVFEDLRKTNKRFKFKQGLDERLLTREKCEVLFTSKYDGTITFAFDNIADYELIESKLQMIRLYTDKVLMFYVLCGFDRNNVYDGSFWYQDIIDVFKRIELLISYKCIPYIMRFDCYKKSPYRGIYVTLARWCNQPSMFKKMSFEEFCSLRSDSKKYLDYFLTNTNFGKEYKKYLTLKY